MAEQKYKVGDVVGLDSTYSKDFSSHLFEITKLHIFTGGYSGVTTIVLADLKIYWCDPLFCHKRCPIANAFLGSFRQDLLIKLPNLYLLSKVELDDDSD